MCSRLRLCVCMRASVCVCVCVAVRIQTQRKSQSERVSGRKIKKLKRKRESLMLRFHQHTFTSKNPKIFRVSFVFCVHTYARTYRPVCAFISDQTLNSIFYIDDSVVSVGALLLLLFKARIEKQSKAKEKKRENTEKCCVQKLLFASPLLEASAEFSRRLHTKVPETRHQT